MVSFSLDLQFCLRSLSCPMMDDSEDEAESGSEL